MKFVGLIGGIHRITLASVSTTGNIYYVNSPTFNNVSFATKGNLTIACSTFTVASGSSTTSYSWHSLSDSEKNDLITAIFGTLDFTDYPDCTITIVFCTGSSATAWHSQEFTLTITINNGMATTSNLNANGGRSAAYFVVKSITMS